MQSRPLPPLYLQTVLNEAVHAHNGITDGLVLASNA